MKVEMISVGTEILLGDIVNTNAAYLSRELASLGFSVYRQTSVGDNKKRLLKAIESAFFDNDIVIFTGGLGPTEDDITRECVAKYFSLGLNFNEQLWEEIEAKILKDKTDQVLTDNNKNSAYVPEGASLLNNEVGTAPGIVIEKDNKIAILLPGPPREMIRMYEQSVKHYLEKFSDKKYLSVYVRFYGIGESTLETKLKELMEFQTNPTLALYAKNGEVMLRITASANNEKECQILIDQQLKKVDELVGEYIYLIGGNEISSSQSELNIVASKLIIENGYTLSLAESVTGGLLTSKLVEQSGISEVLVGSIVSYSNTSKIESLGVSKETLSKYDSVSEEVALEMLRGVQKLFNTDIAVSTTGYAGPLKEGEVGETYIAIYFLGKEKVVRFLQTGERNYVRKRIVSHALSELIKMIIT